MKLVREVTTGPTHRRWMFGLALGWCLAIFGGLGMLTSFYQLDVCYTHGGLDHPGLAPSLIVFVLAAAGVATGCLVLACASKPTIQGADPVRIAHCLAVSLGTLGVTASCSMVLPSGAAAIDVVSGAACMIAGMLLVGGGALAIAIRHRRCHRTTRALPSGAT